MRSAGGGERAPARPLRALARVAALTASIQLCACGADSSDANGASGEPPRPCEDVLCSGHGTCQERDGEAVCDCEAPYVAEGLHCVGDDPADWTTNQIVQYGIALTFDEAVRFGRFANGDYWALGPVNVIRMTPAFDGEHHGWEVNPVYEGPQGYDTRIDDFDASAVPELPYTAQPGDSIVKSVSRDPSEEAPRPTLLKAMVLTVLGEAPPDLGASVFRPPYVSTDKPYYSVDDLRDDLLPELGPVDDTPSLEWVYETFRRVQLDHKSGGIAAYLRPLENIAGEGYAPGMARASADAALRLMVDDADDPTARRQALIAFVQKGIDMYHFLLNGQTFGAGGGHQPGHILPLTFTAVVLDPPGLRQTLASADFFWEQQYATYSEAAGTGLYGIEVDEETYWASLVIGEGQGQSSARDPYGFIDGGYQPGGNYQGCCVSQPFKGTALPFYLLPAMKDVWSHQGFFSYVDRWVNIGTWTQPDPCAPADPSDLDSDGDFNADPAQGSHYTVTYGPDPDHPGECILDADPSDGVGRFPSVHGTETNGGHYGTPFVEAMWEAYRGPSCFDEVCEGEETATSCPYDCN